MKIWKVGKLLANLCDKKEYFIHIISLKQALNHGSILKKCIVSLNPKSHWFENRAKKKRKKKWFWKRFFKMMNNAVFGKKTLKMWQSIEIFSL